MTTTAARIAALYADCTSAEFAVATVATTDAGESRATVAIYAADDTEIAKLDLGEYAWQADAVEAIRAAGWRIYPDTIVPARELGRGYLVAPVFRG